MDSDYFVIGKIVNTQGIKGDLRVIPTTDDISRFELLDFVYIDKRGNLNKYDIQNVRYHKQFVLLKLKGVDDMTMAESFKNSEIKITKDMALPLGEDEYYIRDLYFMEVVTDLGEVLGKIEDIIFTGANDVYVVKNDTGEILIPAIKQCILRVDKENNKMTVRLLEGLR
ncbi:MAG: 16S rRNA processing protein RimM [Clostridiales bacterium]|nr:16S rRNA processing protein RimM [Clostridiales bacterium]